MSDQTMTKRIIIKEPIEFISLTILKRMNCCADRYKNVCLVLDGNIDDQICTNSDHGFDNQTSDWITWKAQSQGI